MGSLVLAQPTEPPGVPQWLPLPGRHQQREVGEERGLQGEYLEAGELCAGQVAAGPNHHTWSIGTLWILFGRTGEI